ncbi:MAG: DUF1549 domain-containing protein [Burkholderiaceae bacterium]
MQPSPEADRITLIRRLSFDLIGLPPTVPEVDAFLNDQSPNAYENVVDRLLEIAALSANVSPCGGWILFDTRTPLDTTAIR